AVMVAYAVGSDLDQLGANNNVERLVIIPADPTAIPPIESVMESDSDFRVRIPQAFEGLSVAGPTGAYEYHAKSADGRVADASAISPTPACVTVTVLSREGNGEASNELLAVVEAALNDENTRPVADRVASLNGAVAAVKAGRLLFIKPGSGVTASGKPIPQMTITRQDGDQHSFSIADRGAYTGVSASWLHTKDPKPAKPKKVKLQRKPKFKQLRALEHPKAKPTRAKAAAVKKSVEEKQGDYLVGSEDNVFVITTVYATQKAAMRAAQSKWEKLQRGVAEFSITLAMGRADLFPETPVAVNGFKSVIDQQSWIISKVSHSLSNSGYTTQLSLEVLLSDVTYEAE
ncbi:baseplate J/gp47 family protein, partial [Yersinia enterocolitica]|nr:baseplate J/gp47 family protein [Yersinia enterocolitica]ELI8179822.1 baseplate J/gp47 family protein [Yersinia enterocolitica]ELI8256741.1 baseplate J/gp47 family protein [Yersinia enterocolitica]ELI8346777.1 baseplate J/gp47 family protein [Yersinia enterocolitica]ELW7337987.1 baseplate J/gp47 family protein [Yersinia enterocolitica]